MLIGRCGLKLKHIQCYYNISQDLLLYFWSSCWVLLLFFNDQVKSKFLVHFQEIMTLLGIKNAFKQY